MDGLQHDGFHIESCEIESTLLIRVIRRAVRYGRCESKRSKRRISKRTRELRYSATNLDQIRTWAEK